VEPDEIVGENPETTLSAALEESRLADTALSWKQDSVIGGRYRGCVKCQPTPGRRELDEKGDESQGGEGSQGGFVLSRDPDAGVAGVEVIPAEDPWSFQKHGVLVAVYLEGPFADCGGALRSRARRS